MISLLKEMHNQGFVYNDLKPDNILIGAPLSRLDTRSYQDRDRTPWSTIKLADFGMAQRYLDADGKHVQMQRASKFMGSMLFASRNAFLMKTCSRRDDLISLCYCLIFFLDMKNLRIIENVNNESVVAQFKHIQKMRSRQSVDDLCRSEPTKDLREFVGQIFRLKYDEQPDYDNLTRILVSKMKYNTPMDWVQKVESGHILLGQPKASAQALVDELLSQNHSQPSRQNTQSHYYAAAEPMSQSSQSGFQQ